MADEKYGDYLAARVLTENTPVTYRLLSRALGANANSAKWMLFDFHQKQNAKKPGSVHATYLVAGTKRATKHANGVNNHDGDDAVMRSSPFMSSMPEPEEPAEEPVKTTSIVLVREEELEKTRVDFEGDITIHIYSLESGPLENLNVLSVCNHEIQTKNTGEDPMQRWKTYGSIHNPYVKRRTAKYAPPPAAVSALKPAAKPVVKPAAKLGANEKQSTFPMRKGSASEENASGRSTPQPSAGISTLKRSDSKSGIKKEKVSHDIFKSFAKAKSKPKEADKSKESTPAPADDDLMQGMSEDEGEGDEEPVVKIDEEKNEAARKAREDRAEKLRKMMEDDDEDMPDVSVAADSQREATPTATPDAMDSNEPEPTVTVQGGRRRGRRRVMKKKKVKDEDGYLVTKEEAVWESFSEDEPEPKKLKPAPAKPTPAAKGKAGVKKGQGSIANFFKKT